ncbi:unnamed protein product [Litomosoides sigmodontis]|uniref:Uncharacterized protein n=1 Tax=Litomosoides sigmodontis TaxID=42156 RepID=A0A3P6RXX3_LITSI|nr:unnamed protein product [Litomosoides sigmodontis]
MMRRTVLASFLLQILLGAQLHLCAEAEGHDTRGLFARPACCEAPWKFNTNTGQCILDMMEQGVKDEDMPMLCTNLGFQLRGKKCIRHVQLTYKATDD